jgi:hypothetical protein
MGSEDVSQRPKYSVESVIVEEGFKMFSLPNLVNGQTIEDHRQVVRNRQTYRNASHNLKAAN